MTYVAPKCVPWHSNQEWRSIGADTVFKKQWHVLRAKLRAMLRAIPKAMLSALLSALLVDKSIVEITVVSITDRKPTSSII